MKDLKYPIKYTYKPFYNNGSIDGYIVSKVYLVKEEKEYCSDGEVKLNFKVVYPYPFADNSINILDNFDAIRKYPVYSNEVVNSVSVIVVYDTYEKAKLFVNELNKNILNSHSKEEQEAILDKMKEYRKFEKDLLSKTKDMKVYQNEDIYNMLLDLENKSDKIACKTLEKYIERK